VRGVVVVMFACGFGYCAGLYAQQKNFVACPIVRDTKTVPCYLTEYEGETYFLGTQESLADTHAPELKHDVLVEGTVATGPRVCGGIPLSPVSISVMKELNLACNTLLPAEPGIEAPAAAPIAAPPQSNNHVFTILYSFDDEHLDARGERVLNEAATEAKRGGSGVKVTGYRVTTVLSNGQRLVEKPGLEEKRAQNVAALLRGLGVAKISVDAKRDAAAGERHVTIEVGQ
jgi:hypothetical protein